MKQPNRRQQLIRIVIFLVGITLSASRSSYGQEKIKYSTLSSAEKWWAFTHPFVAVKARRVSNTVKEIVKKMASDTLIGDYNNGGRLDAFRHALWMACLSREMRWKKAWKLGLAHEKGNKKDFKKARYEEGMMPDAISYEMDVWNNSVGIDIGIEHIGASTEDLINIVKLAVANGKCRIIRRNKNGQFIDAKGESISDSEWIGKWKNQKCLVASDYQPL